MDTVIANINALLSLLMAGVIVWAIVSHRVQDGIVIKLGLVAMALGLGFAAVRLLDGLACNDLLYLTRARLLTNLGIILAVVGCAWRLHSGQTLADIVQFNRKPDTPGEDHA